MKHITDVDYKHTKTAWKAFQMKIFGNYYDLHVQNDTFLLVAMFQNFYSKRIGIDNDILKI